MNTAKQALKNRQLVLDVGVALDAAGIEYSRISKEALRVKAEFGVVVYYPCSQKWQYHGQNHMGDFATFLGWIKRPARRFRK